MDAASAVEQCRRLLGLAVSLQALELLLVAPDLASGALYPLPQARMRVLHWLWGPGFVGLSCLQIAVGLQLLVTAPTAALVALPLTLALIAGRFAGNLNGGSDRMTWVVLSGLCIDLLTGWWPTARLVGLGWICAQLTLSYFVAGVAKLRESAWREGSALGLILNSGHYLVPLAVRSMSRPVVRALGYASLAFELGLPLVFVVPGSATAFVTVALGFHLANFFVLGLNRFVFAWLAAWPALWFFISAV